MSHKKFGYTYEYFHEMCPFYTDKNMCAGCGKFFNSTTAFDKHRIDDPDGKYGRRCLDTTEMLEKGMAQKESGHWVSKLMTQEDVGRTVERRSHESKGVG